MNNIVLYKATFSLGLFLITFGLPAQKPAIDLIPSSHQVLRSEAMVDSSFVHDTLSVQGIPGSSNVREGAPDRPKVHKERRQIGPSIDSLLRKPGDKKADRTKRNGNIPLYIRKFNPVKFFISMVALK